MGKRAEKEIVYGLAAGMALFARRPEDVLRIAHTPDARHPLATLLKEAARRRIAYREVDEEEMARIAESMHHEGLCMLTRRRSLLPIEEAPTRLGQGVALALDAVDNPHNVGAIVRTAAYFGARALILPEAPGAPLKPAAVRIAEGGAEHVPVARGPLATSLGTLRKAGVAVIGADMRASASAFDHRFAGPSVLVLGNERTGLSEAVRAACDKLVAIPGTRAVESLNVSVAAGVLLALATGRGLSSPA